MEERHILEVDNLQIGFHSVLKNKKSDIEKNNLVVKGISFHAEAGEIVGIVGESGSGKTMTALAMMNLLPKDASIVDGSICFDGKELLQMNKRQLRALKGEEISMIFQEPMTSLNPLMRIGIQVEEMLRNHSEGSKEEIQRRVADMLVKVGLQNPEGIVHLYPHQLSGGMKQRVMIAIAMICHPRLMIADEPTTALDVTIQAQILKLIKELNQEYGTTVILISHDLGVIQSVCDRALVMKAGKIVEEGPVEELFYRPQEDYTRELLNAVPSIHHRLSAQMIQHKDRTQKTIVQVKHLNSYYDEKQEKLFRKPKKIQILQDVSLTLAKGEIMGIVGESGSGKSTLAKIIGGLHKDIQGEVILNTVMPQMVFQDTYGSLNPVKKVEWILEEPLRIRGGYTKAERKEIVYENLAQVGLLKEHGKRYLQELSGGQRQRVNIANALILKPELVILDEPVSALDVTIQNQILKLLLKLREKQELTYLFISHDLNVVAQICDRVCVMYQGKIVEDATVEELYRNPQHEYSRVLLGANSPAMFYS